MGYYRVGLSHKRCVKLAARALFDAGLTLFDALVAGAAWLKTTQSFVKVDFLDVARVSVLIKIVMAVAMSAVQTVTMVQITTATSIQRMLALMIIFGSKEVLSA